MKDAKITIIMKDARIIKLEFTGIEMVSYSMLFSRINEALILNNLNEKDIIKMTMIFKEAHLC